MILKKMLCSGTVLSAMKLIVEVELIPGNILSRNPRITYRNKEGKTLYNKKYILSP